MDETPGEKQMREELEAAAAELDLRYHVWTKHYYPEGNAPPHPQPLHDATAVLIRAGNKGEAFPPETLGHAAGLILALRKQQRLAELAQVEWDTTREPQLLKELLVHDWVVNECRRQWVEHYYPGAQPPDDPQPYFDALKVIVAEARGEEEFPKETVTAAHTYDSALDRLQESINNMPDNGEEVDEASRKYRKLRGEDPHDEQDL